MRFKGIVLGMVAGIAIGLTIGSSVAQQDNEKQAASTRDVMYSVGWLTELARERYVEELDYNLLMEGATQGMLSTLDRYSSYLPPDVNSEFRDSTQGEFGGLGIQIQFMPIEKLIRIESPIPGTPAFRKGVLAGDLIYQVKEEATGTVIKTEEFQTVHDAVRVLRGEPGTKVTISVLHGETGKREDFTITRAVIKIPGVRGTAVIDEEHKIGYVYIPHFHARMVDDLKESLAELKQQGIKGLVIDLRFNPGGLLESAIAMSDLFLDKGKIVVSTKGRSEPEDIYTTTDDDSLTGVAIAVLVNGSSASASEIVTAALKDNGRAIVVGESTFGKASVQKLFNHPKTEGAVKMTVARYYTPDGTLIEGKGVEPDVVVDLDDETTRTLARYIALKTDFVPQPEDETGTEPAPEEPKDDPEPAAEDADEDEELDPAELLRTFKDEQLERTVQELVKVMTGKATVEAPDGAAAQADPAPLTVE